MDDKVFVISKNNSDERRIALFGIYFGGGVGYGGEKLWTSGLITSERADGERD